MYRRVTCEISVEVHGENYKKDNNTCKNIIKLKVDRKRLLMINLDTLIIRQTNMQSSTIYYMYQTMRNDNYLSNISTN